MPSPAILIRAISNLKNAFQQQVKYRSRLTCQGPQHLSTALATVALVTELVGMKCTFCFSQKLPDLVQGRSFRTDFWVCFCRNSLADRSLFSLGPTSWSSHKEHSLRMGKNSWIEANAHGYAKNSLTKILLDPILLSGSELPSGLSYHQPYSGPSLTGLGEQCLCRSFLIAFHVCKYLVHSVLITSGFTNQRGICIARCKWA